MNPDELDKFLLSQIPPDEMAACWAVLALTLAQQQQSFRPMEIGHEHDAARKKLIAEIRARYK